MDITLVKSEDVQITAIKEKRTFRIVDNGVERTFTVLAAREFWADEEVAMNFVRRAARQADIDAFDIDLTKN